jgi:hypothetical protein
LYEISTIHGNNYYYKKNKPAFKALILLAKELEKNDTSISVFEISETKKTENEMLLISPKSKIKDIPFLYDQFSNFPTLKQLRKKAWPKISL